jgi:hypothetical protein
VIGTTWIPPFPLAFMKYICDAMLISTCSMLRDVDYFIGKLGKIEGFGDLGTYLIKIIESKEIKSALSIDSTPVPAKATKEGKGKSDENTEPPIEK